MNLAQQLINGLVLGSGYALIAIGWTVLLGAARLVNFAHGQLYMLGAFVAWAIMQELGLSYYLAVPLAVLMLGLLGVLLQAMMLPLVMQQNLTSLMIVTLGFGYVMTGGAAKIFGGDPQAIVSPLTETSIRFGDIWFTWQDVVTLVERSPGAGRPVPSSGPHMRWPTPGANFEALAQRGGPLSIGDRALQQPEGRDIHEGVGDAHQRQRQIGRRKLGKRPAHPQEGETGADGAIGLETEMPVLVRPLRLKPSNQIGKPRHQTPQIGHLQKFAPVPEEEDDQVCPLIRIGLGDPVVLERVDVTVDAGDLFARIGE